MSSPTIIIGALLSQFLMVSILMVGAAILRGASTKTAWWKGEHVYQPLWPELLILLLVSVGALVFTTTMSTIWGALFNESSFAGIGDDTALLIMFVSNILVITRIVFFTGGSVNSPFQPLFFFIPTIALLLRESAFRVIAYSLVVSISFFILLNYSKPVPSENPNRTKQAYGFISIACLLLAVVIGLLTRR